MTTTYTRPEAWHARVLRDEVEQLTIAVRILEFADGYMEGRVSLTEPVETTSLRAVR